MPKSNIEKTNDIEEKEGTRVKKASSKAASTTTKKSTTKKTTTKATVKKTKSTASSKADDKKTEPKTKKVSKVAEKDSAKKSAKKSATKKSTDAEKKASTKSAAKTKSTTSKVVSKAKELLDEISPIVKEEIKKVTTRTKKKVDETTPIVKNEVKKVTTKTKKKIDEATPIIKEEVKKVTTRTKKKVDEITPVVKEEVKKAATRTKKKVDEVTPIVKDEVKKVSNRAKKKVDEVTPKVKKTVKGAVPTAKKTLKKVVSKTKDTINEIASSFIDIVEYYDLPYRYNKTTVKVLAQDPNTLFVYWDLNDNDLQYYKEQYGDNFIYITKPVLVVHNITNNYSFEIDINDFANNWYIHVNDTKCKYIVELGRRPNQSNEIFNVQNNEPTQFVKILSSNEIENPNDRVLFYEDNQKLYFKDIKTNAITEKIVDKKQTKHFAEIYKCFSLDNDSTNNKFDFENPSSNNPTSNVM